MLGRLLFTRLSLTLLLQIREKRQYGVDGDPELDYSGPLPPPFTSRPRIGSRLFIRSHASRFLKPLMKELGESGEEEFEGRFLSVVFSQVIGSPPQELELSSYWQLPWCIWKTTSRRKVIYSYPC